MKKKTLNPQLTRRQVLKAGLYTGAGMMVPWRYFPGKAHAAVAAAGLSDPALQPKFVNPVPNALDPGFIFQSPNNKYKIAMEQKVQMTGLIDPEKETPLPTTVWGYGKNGPGGTWPGMTFVARSGEPVEVKWENKLPKGPHLLPVDTSLHWAYALHGYEQYSIEKDGTPVIAHLHGGHSDFQFDGNPEFFFSPGYTIRGPQWVDGIEKKFVYHNDQPAGTLWYHDHALGITRLNVYAGLAGFYILRDSGDTGEPGNPLDLPAYPYEVALAIQDRMFEDTGALFYPAFPGDPFYADFITGEGATLPPDIFPGGGPTALAEFFGDHMLVNGQIWPKMEVEPRNYRLRLLNGCDSRFLVVEFWEVSAGETEVTDPNGDPIGTRLPFTVIGSDQGLASSPTTVDTLLVETGSRYDVIFDFKNVKPGKRVIMKNIGGDEPFGGDIPGPQVFGETDRIMAFDVNQPLDTTVPDVSPTGINFGPVVPAPTRLRKVALFEGKDEFGRLQPLLGTAEPATDYEGNDINWPAKPEYQQARLPDGTLCPLTGQMEGSIAWHSPTTENPALDSTEEWEIWNMTGDAHPVHLHLVHFEILNRQEINLDDNADEDGFIEPKTYYLDEELISGSTTVKVTTPIDTKTAASGKIIVVSDGNEEIQVCYSSYNGNTFTLYEPFGDVAAIDNEVYVPVPADDGVYLVTQPTVQHNSVANDETTYGMGFKIVHPSTPANAYGPVVNQPDGYVENAPKDMVTALPGQITRIKATFDKPGRYVWHCHILSHEDHEMMRVLYVGPEA